MGSRESTQCVERNGVVGTYWNRVRVYRSETRPRSCTVPWQLCSGGTSVYVKGQRERERWYGVTRRVEKARGRHSDDDGESASRRGN